MSHSGSRMDDEALGDTIHRGRHPVTDEIANNNNNNNNNNESMLSRVVKKKRAARSPRSPRGAAAGGHKKNHRARPSSAPPFFKRPCAPASLLRRNDPHDLVGRYIRPQSELFDTALFELRQGRKRSCWFWFVLPTAPYIVDGEERGSSTNRHYALRTDAQVEAYLKAETTMGVNLRQNYIDTLAEIECQLETQQCHRRRDPDDTAMTDLKRLLGPLDAVKAISSFRLFERIAKHLNDEEVHTICAKILKRIDDPHDLVERYILPQSDMFDTALSELRQGEKRSCWFWFVLPTAPYIVNGEERGSSTNRHYALRTDAQVEAYLKAETTMGVNLRQNYIDTLAEIECHLTTQQHRQRRDNADDTAKAALDGLLGPWDAVKAISSFRLFERIARRLGDEEVYTICAKVLKRLDDC